MHVHFEQNISTRSECTIHSLSWMGKVPDSLPDQEEGWKLNRNQYYQEGWLASGNAKGVVGVTFTTSHCRKYEPPARSNFNLRGHRSEVVLVKWNEPYQKLATCDAQGIIFVWIKHEGRWSIELINDRNNQVTDFAWSHDGRMALICYRDGFVLVGSVTGQRYWSSMLNLDSCIITCGVWTPDDQKVLFGTSDGQIVVMSSTGAMLSQVTIQDGLEISAMAWSCEKFNMEEVENDVDMTRSEEREMQEYTIAVCFKYGAIYLMANFDDVCPRIIHTTLTGVRMDWSNYGEILAVGGFTRLPNLQCRNEIHFYTKDGRMNHLVNVPSQGKPLTALCWGHNDRRLFIAAGYTLFVAWVNKQVSPLQLLCQRIVQTVLREEQRVDRLPLPSQIKSGVKSLFSPTIKSYIPDPFKLREFVSTPPPGNERLYCTMIRHGDETSGGHYTLYLEYLGGLVPLLKGKRASKIRPDFVIYDPTIKTNDIFYSNTQGDNSRVQSESDSDASHDGCGSPRMQRKKRAKQFRLEKVDRSITFRTLDELLYNDNLPESNKLVDIKSNIWGTKFQITGLIPIIPEDLGSVLYKTSLLHLQPRQMTISISELTRNGHQLSKDPNFTPAGGGSEDEEDRLSEDNLDSDSVPSILPGEGIPIAPETLNHVKISNQNNSDLLTVNISSNQQEVMIEIESKSNENNSECIQSGNSSGRTRRSPSMKNRTLSPAANTVTQNNHAFNNDISNITKDSYIKQGARPKASTHINTLGVANTLTSDLSLNLTSNNIDSNGAQNSSKQDVPSVLRSERADSSPRWADPAFQGIHFAEEDICPDGDITYENNIVRDSCQIAPVSTPENCRRLYLAQNDLQEMDSTDAKDAPTENGNSMQFENGCEEFSDGEMLDISDRLIGTHNSLDTGIDCLNENSFTVNKKMSDFDSALEITQSTSLPASPIRRNFKCDSSNKNLREEILKTKCKHYSPIFKRKNKHSKDPCVEEDMTFSLDDIKIAHKFKDLESFQKAQLRHKLKKKKVPTATLR